jgi:DNA-binding NarL/FixJ family response regulator
MSDHTILIADDHQLILTGLRIVINGSGDFSVSAEARTGDEVLAALETSVPDIAVLDIGMSAGARITGEARETAATLDSLGFREPSQYGGLLIVSYLKSRFPSMGILIVTQQESPTVIQAARDLHVNGVLLKDDVNENILSALQRIVRGEPVLSAKVESILEEHRDRDPNLSDREKQVFELVAHGFKDKEIADRLEISARTVAFHKGNLKEKLNAETTAELIAYYHEQRR